ncbi:MULTISPECIES: CPBP family intramembrane glutamic endopeptidase [Paenibacillus]|uniref:CPBP family intramembrane glutamic endopeptidase n=1 Tax=Paenibacillus TaxID=44249 RepID=UPI0022B875FF|nr:CPBP family intramembrane glutamic endopeptidase [Paenibacillus caseinilyticus]MCZ8518256.1 CPBP family intramembrane metalloprotease [Paenibacillus caseinilyticus]
MKKIGWMLVNIAVFLGLIQAAAKVHAFVYKLPALHGYKSFLSHNPGMHLGIICTFILIVYTVLLRAKAAVRKDKQLSLAAVCRFHKLAPRQVIFLVGMGILGCLFSIGLIDITFLAKTFPSIPQMVTDMMETDSFLFVLIGAGIMAPVFEEVLFRGLVFNQLRSAMPLWAALLLQAAIYAYFQPSLIISVISVGSGIIYALLYVRMNSLWAPIIMQVTAMSLIYAAKYWGLYEMISSIGQPALYAITIASLIGLMAGAWVVWKREDDLTAPISTKAA